MQSDKTCPILEQYLAYLLTIKGRSQNTILEHRMDLLQFFRYIANQRRISEISCEFADADFIRSIQLSDMYGFIAYQQESLNKSADSRCSTEHHGFYNEIAKFNSFSAKPLEKVPLRQ